MARHHVDRLTPSQLMASIGIRQRGDPVLLQQCEPFRFPEEASEAAALASQLIEIAEKAKTLHNFSKGIGLAAPQIGVAKAAAVVWMPDRDPIILLNPRIVGASNESDQQFEGCLSFFDVRGEVTRSLAIQVEILSPAGIPHQVSLDHGTARLAAHEIDHLSGCLYVDRMTPEQHIVDVSEYDGSGSPWQY